jgi:hypothetical protein
VEEVQDNGQAAEEDTLPPHELQRYNFYGMRATATSLPHLGCLRHSRIIIHGAFGRRRNVWTPSALSG